MIGFKRMCSTVGLLCALGFLSIVNAGQMNLQRKRRIIGGSRLDIANAKFMVRLIMWNGKYHTYCSGSLIRSDWVLTAAHCVEDIQEENVKVIGNVGTARDLRPVFGRVWRKYIAVDLLKLASVDAALLQLKKPMKGKNVGTIEYEYSRIIHSGDRLITVGFGVTCKDNIGIGILHFGNVFAAPDKLCKSHFPLDITDELMFCAMIDNQNPCGDGDSGGPIVAEGRVAGIISQTFNTSTNYELGVHTRVQAIADWIWNTMNSAEVPPGWKFWTL